MANQIKASEAMLMNRKTRRLLGKINKVKIPGIQKPIVGKQAIPFKQVEKELAQFKKHEN